MHMSHYIIVLQRVIHKSVLFRSHSLISFRFRHLWQRKEHLQQLRIIRSSQTSRWIPPRCGRKAISAASRGVARSDVVEDLSILVQGGIYESDRAFALSRALFVDQRDQRRPDRRGERGTELLSKLAVLEEREECAIRSNI